MKLSAYLTLFPLLLALGSAAQQHNLQTNQDVLQFVEENAKLHENFHFLPLWNEILTSYKTADILRRINAFNAHPHASQTLRKPSRLNWQSYETVTSRKHPNYALRVSKHDPAVLGIDSVKQSSGYLDYNDKHFFYWFFESRSDPANDPVVLWLNGGPGCSSMTGLFFELGPSSLSFDLRPVHNNHSWNSNASVVFLEQPVGVGYSYGSGKVSSSYAAAADVFVFLELFFQQHPQLLRNRFHIAGESYAGHYIPAIASEILNHADRTFELHSVLVGNGITDALVQNKYYQPMACGLGGHPQLLADSQCDQMLRDYPKCARLVQACYRTRSAFACVPAELYCSQKLLGPFQDTGLNFYDVRGPCESNSSLCYTEMEYIEQYLNLPHVQHALGAEVQSYAGCSDDVFSSFAMTGDGSKPFQHYIAELLDSHVPVLIYAGDKDFICNWLGNFGWSDNLDWQYQREFQAEYLKPWKNSANRTIGQVKSFGNFTFLRVFDAGHMVPHDQPEAALQMLNSWTGGDYALQG